MNDNILSGRERELLKIIRKEMKDIEFGVLTIDLIVKQEKIVRVEASTTKRAYKI